MDVETIKARRLDIEQAAPCEGCGATRAFCESQRGKDPTAPLWFGCCARGAPLSVPCRHVPDQVALRTLLQEIETGEVRSVEEVMFDSMTPWTSSRRPGLRSRVMAAVFDDWPDDVPMTYR